MELAFVEEGRFAKYLLQDRKGTLEGEREERKGGEFKLRHLEAGSLTSGSSQERQEKDFVAVGRRGTLHGATIVSNRIEHLLHKIQPTRVDTLLMGKLVLVEMEKESNNITGVSAM